MNGSYAPQTPAPQAPAEQAPVNGAAPKPRDGFASGLGVIAATLGSAIGLGNIWKFPVLTGLNGARRFFWCTWRARCWSGCR